MKQNKDVFTKVSNLSKVYRSFDILFDIMTSLQYHEMNRQEDETLESVFISWPDGVNFFQRLSNDLVDACANFLVEKRKMKKESKLVFQKAKLYSQTAVRQYRKEWEEAYDKLFE